MEKKRIIDLQKVGVAKDKVSANPKLLQGLNNEIDKWFKEVGIDLNADEKRHLLTLYLFAEKEGPVFMGYA